MSPILVRPVREQLEHDRVIRLLQAKYKRKSEVAINPGNQQVMPVGAGPSAWYPDLVLYASEKNRKVIGVVEVETAESVNNLEAMSQWATFSRLRVPFHLYVPASYVDVARRLCADLQLVAPEVWTYQTIGDQIRFALVQRGAYGEPKGGRASDAAPAKSAPVKSTPARPAPAKSAPVKSTPARPAPAKPAPAKASKPAPGKTGAAKPVKAAARPAGKSAKRTKPSPKVTPRPKGKAAAPKPARKAAPARGKRR